VDKCYKLHGYPPGYKPNRPKAQFPYANQVQEFQSDPESHHVNTPVLSIIQEQHQQLLALLKPSSSEISASVNQVGSTSANQDHIFSTMSGILNCQSNNFFNSSHSVLFATHFKFFQVASKKILTLGSYILVQPTI
jgi:hypothetical protein